MMPVLVESAKTERDVSARRAMGERASKRFRPCQFQRAASYPVGGDAHLGGEELALFRSGGEALARDERRRAVAAGLGERLGEPGERVGERDNHAAAIEVRVEDQFRFDGDGGKEGENALLNDARVSVVCLGRAGLHVLDLRPLRVEELDEGRSLEVRTVARVELIDDGERRVGGGGGLEHGVAGELVAAEDALDEAAMNLDFTQEGDDGGDIVEAVGFGACLVLRIGPLLVLDEQKRRDGQRQHDHDQAEFAGDPEVRDSGKTGQMTSHVPSKVARANVERETRARPGAQSPGKSLLFPESTPGVHA